MADATKKIHPGLLVLGLAVTGATIFTIFWAASKGWSVGKK